MGESIQYLNLVMAYDKAKQDHNVFARRAFEYAAAGESLMADTCQRLSEATGKESDRLFRELTELRNSIGGFLS